MSAFIYFLSGASASAGQEVPIHLFAGGRDGQGYAPALLVQPNGTIYGVHSQAGKYLKGEVFRLSKPSGGATWTKTSIYSFLGAADGYGPYGKLVAGPHGSLYGTTQLGGESADPSCSPEITGCGTVFQLIPPAQPGSPWTKFIIHSFSDEEGAAPHGLVIDSTGKLYGTTSTTVFELDPPVTGVGWTLQVLHYFGGADGTYVGDDLLLDENGNLFGSTPDGGIYGHGTVFRLSRSAGKGWAYLQLHDFAGAPADGDAPNGGLRGEAGDIWGTTQAGGADNAGTIFELRQEIAGSPLYTSIVHYSFGSGPDGGAPLAGLFQADDGSYWGTTSAGGFVDPDTCSAGCGVIFELKRKFLRFEYVYVYSVASEFFGKSYLDGSCPFSSLGADQNGSLYGVTLDGGLDAASGTVFELADAVPVLPAATPSFTPAAGVYTSPQTVTIADTTSEATIYYTTNGTPPTQNSTPYSGAIKVSSTAQIRAIAFVPGYTKSTVATAKYTITP
jgi:hypothetical protein